MAFRKILFEQGPLYNGEGKPAIILPIILIAILLLKETIDERREASGYSSTTALTSKWDMARNVISSAVLFIVILLCASFEGGQFIYFQF